jgi:UDP-2,3-diacylglucosamine pyrophosphatase LpxH
MAQSNELIWKKLDEIWSMTSIPVLATKGQRYALISDLHLGNGGKADDFTHNRSALLRALSLYDRNGYTLILLGDIEELWQFDLTAITTAYDDTVYRKIRAMGDERVMRVFGNHDLEWGGLMDPTRDHDQSACFAPEGLKLLDGEGQERFILVHGHQGSLESDTYIWFSRFFVRLYAGIEPFLKTTGLVRSPSATQSQIAKNFERVRYTWARRNKAIIICGHTHRAIFAAKSYADRLKDRIEADSALMQSEGVSNEEKRRLSLRIKNNRRELEDEKKKGRLIDPVDPAASPLPCYFNTGCGLYTEGITTIEIDDDLIRLVKWNSDWDIDSTSGNQREVLQEGRISLFVDQIKRDTAPNATA